MKKLLFISATLYAGSSFAMESGEKKSVSPKAAFSAFWECSCPASFPTSSRFYKVKDAESYMKKHGDHAQCIRYIINENDLPAPYLYTPIERKCDFGNVANSNINSRLNEGAARELVKARLQAGKVDGCKTLFAYLYKDRVYDLLRKEIKKQAYVKADHNTVDTYAVAYDIDLTHVKEQ